MSGPLHGRHVLITGASRGLGVAIARVFAAQGARVVIHANAARAAAEALSAELGVQSLGVLVEDLALPGAGTRLFAAADALAGGRLDVLVNNAGIFIDSALAADDADWQAAWTRTLQVNLIAAADLARAAVLAFAARGGGSVISIASRAGHRGDDADHTAYAASKGGLLALTKTLARAYSAQNVLAYAIAPGWIDTEMAPQDAAGRALATRDIPLGRMAAPEEIAAACAFLASGACPSATGSCLDINGASYVR
jgi:3-oxoacyl-[acyl-carrier protein] reductase